MMATTIPGERRLPPPPPPPHWSIILIFIHNNNNNNNDNCWGHNEHRRRNNDDCRDNWGRRGKLCKQCRSHFSLQVSLSIIVFPGDKVLDQILQV